MVQSDPGGPAGREAGSALFSRHQGKVYLWCYRYARERERALDMAQEVLARAWRALPGFSFRSRFSWWLFVITRNCCCNAVTAPSLLLDPELEPDSLPATNPGPAEEYERRADEEGTRQLMMDHLDDQERLALWLCCFERMPMDGITRSLGLTNATGARALIQRARRKLRSALDVRAQEGTG